MHILGGDIFKDGDEVQFILAKEHSLSFGGYIKMDNNKIIGAELPNSKFFAVDEIFLLAHNSKDISVTNYYKKVELLKKAQTRYIDNYNGELVDITTEIIDYTEYQRSLFEHCYYDKSHLEHVNWFAPSACYYPKGWYNLGGKQSKKSDKIGEQVDQQWQCWRMALLQNKWAGNITSEMVTFKGF